MTKSTKRNTQAEGRVPGLGDAELVLLTSGSQQSDGLIEGPKTMKPTTRQRAGANLLKRGLAEERQARADGPVWREQGGERIALRITTAGLVAIGIETSDPDTASKTASAGAADPAHPREGSKGALLIKLLSRQKGASIDELMGATGWLSHTTRAALSGLRKRGFEIDRHSVEGASRYRIGTSKPEPAPFRRGRKPRATEAWAAA